MGEFDELKGKLEPDFPKTDIKKPFRNKYAEKILRFVERAKLDFDDFWNIFLAILRDEALDKVDPSRVSKVSHAITYVCLGIAVLFIISLFYLMVR